MRVKQYKVRSLGVAAGQNAAKDLNLEFEGDRAFVVWDSISVGNFMIKARVEINPLLLQKDMGTGFDFLYRGELVLPRPENN